jgi:hypothetical protein
MKGIAPLQEEIIAKQKKKYTEIFKKKIFSRTCRLNSIKLFLG